ncbi:MAG: tRNA-dihydrouridine synthase family protein, partial [bacterium]
MKKNFWQKIKKPILALAPMAGVTDSAFRQICKKYGADVVYTEMVSADGLYYDSKKTLEFLRFAKAEQPVVIQLFGKHPEKFTKAAQLAEKAGFAGIDINFGCPAKKVAGHGGGVTLMRDLPKCREIIEAVLAGTKLPVSIKIRASIKKGKETVTALDFLQTIKDLPIAAIMFHGRSYEVPFSGDPDYEMIKKAKVLCPHIPLLGNGGVNSPEDAKKMLDLSGCDGFGLARGLYGKPWLFDLIKDYLKAGKYKPFTPK